MSDKQKKRIKKMKYHPHGSALFITFSLEEGLLLLCNPLCEILIKSCLARAQYLYPVTICGLLVEPNHVHLVLVVDKPDDVPAFMRYFKAESAHMLNRILGRRKRTIWCESYDDPIVLTLPRALLVLAYIYSNPSKDGLEDSIDSYPGVSTWKMFVRGEYTKTWKRLRRDAFRHLPRDMQSVQGFTREAKRLLSQSREAYDFTIKPGALLDAFGITSTEAQERIHERLIAHVAKLEERARRKRERQHVRVIGSQRLQAETFNLTHQSSRKGKRMWCLSEKRSVRAKFIAFLRDLFERARAVQARWSQGDFSVPYPPGLYPPAMPKLVEPLFTWG